jgi:hypothetical protein
MDKIFILNHKSHEKNHVGSLIGQKDQTLYPLSIETSIENNEVHRFISQSSEFCTIRSGDTPKVALFKYGRGFSMREIPAEDFTLIELNVKPGDYYPRVFRPFLLKTEAQVYLFSDSLKIRELESKILNYPEFIPGERGQVLPYVNQLGILKEMLISALNTIHPSPNNLKAFGLSLKNIIVLSCIEVETHLTGIYKEHEVTSRSSMYKTNDFFRLKDLLKLDKYEVSLPFYPELEPFSPFKNWKSTDPSKSLSWYNAYNALKHHSEIEFDKATLINAIFAVGAVAVLIIAQYGSNIPFWSEKVGGFFYIKNNSEWATEDKILPPLTKNEWRIKKFGLFSPDPKKSISP